MTNSSTNPDTSNPTNSSSSNPTIPNTTSASTASSSVLATSTTVSSSETVPSNSSGCSSTASCHHHSPYDLRKKSPVAHCSADNWLGCAGPSTSSTSNATCTSGSQQQSSASSSHSHHNFSINNSSNANFDYLPARKRPRRTYSSTDTSTTMSAAHYLQYEMPDEVLLTIFSYLMEQDLCRVSLVCKRFQTIANDCELWKRLYQSVYEYDLPLFNPEHCKFLFMKVEDCDFSNPWKESFHQLYRGIHVRPNYQDRKHEGRNISYFNTVQAALDYADERNSNNAGSNQISSAMSNVSNSNLSMNVSPGSPMNDDNLSIQDSPGSLIFLHAGIYRGEFLVIDSDITLIGAAPGNVAESIVLERESESTVMFVEGAKNAYIGHMTLKFSPDITSTVPHHKHYCLEVGENCSPTIDHCIIRSTSVGKIIIKFYVKTFFFKPTFFNYSWSRSLCERRWFQSVH